MTYDYDALDRLVLTTYDDSSTTGYIYDAGDRAIAIADSVGGTIARTYDELDRLTSETTPEGTVAYSYDAAGRRATMDVSGQSQIAYAYDDASRLTSITQSTAVVSFAYDAANRRATLTLPNGIVTEYGYDATSQLTSLTYKLSGSSIGDLTYTYDAAGQRSGVGGSWARTNLPAALASATYDAANQIATLGGVAFTYDLNGNLTADGTNSYTWNARDQLIALAGSSSGSFQYDATGRRRNKTIGSSTTRFLYDRFNIVQEQSAGGTPTANLLTGLRVDETVMRIDVAGASALLVDALGSTFALADSNAVLQTQYTYEPFGTVTSTGSASSNSIGFTGREVDASALTYYRRRYYDARLQRFISEDPLGHAGGPNLFAYAGNSPVMLTDPLGLKPNPAFGAPPGDPASAPPSAAAPPSPPTPPSSAPDGEPDPDEENGSGAGPIYTHSAGSVALNGLDLAVDVGESGAARAGAAGTGALAEMALGSEAFVSLLGVQVQHSRDINNACLQLELSCGVPPVQPNPKPTPPNPTTVPSHPKRKK